MNTVITAAEARKITRGREPLVPVEYETAVKALAACVTLDEAKYWDNKADALAAWAKIYHDKKVEREAAALKLWAYRRMGELAGELRPQKNYGGSGGGLTPGPLSLLKENGLTKSNAMAARRLARVSREHVEALSKLPRPPAPATAAYAYLAGKGSDYRGGGGAPAFSSADGWKQVWRHISSAATAVGQYNAATMGRSVIHEQRYVRERIVKLQEWLDEFERNLPKGGKK